MLNKFAGVIFLLLTLPATPVLADTGDSSSQVGRYQVFEGGVAGDKHELWLLDTVIGKVKPLMDNSSYPNGPNRLYGPDCGDKKR